MFDEPFDLLLYHLLLRQKHIFQDFHQLRLQLSVADALPHLHDLDDSLLNTKCGFLIKTTYFFPHFIHLITTNLNLF